LYTPADRRLPKLTDQPKFVLQNLRVIPRYYTRYLAGLDPLGPELLRDALILRTRAEQAINGTFVRRIPIPSLCAAEVFAESILGDDPAFCGGQLYAVIEPVDGSHRSKVLCSNDPRHTVEAKDWITHLEQIGTDA
jgi:hypothetical protein